MLLLWWSFSHFNIYLFTKNIWKKVNTFNWKKKNKMQMSFSRCSLSYWRWAFCYIPSRSRSQAPLPIQNHKCRLELLLRLVSSTGLLCVCFVCVFFLFLPLYLVELSYLLMPWCCWMALQGSCSFPVDFVVLDHISLGLLLSFLLGELGNPRSRAMLFFLLHLWECIL